MILDSRFKINGFTLVEIIVVVAITTILTGALIVYSRQSERQILLNVEKAKIAQTILRLKSLTLSSYTKPPTSPPPCSYGFYVDYTREVYGLFEYVPPEGCENILTVTAIDTGPNFFREIESSTLDKSLDFNIGPSRIGYLIFVPPDPKLILFNESKQEDTLLAPMTVYLKTKDSSLEAKITINNVTGQLSF